MKKKDVLDALAHGRADFLAALDGLTDEQMLEPGANGDWSVKDVLFHLTMWEAETVRLLWQASQGETPTTIHFSSSSVDEVNAGWEKEAQGRSLEQVRNDFDAVRKQTIRRINAFGDMDLENPTRFTWLNGTPLWKWVAEDTFIHEAEHVEQIQAWRREKNV